MKKIYLLGGGVFTSVLFTLILGCQTMDTISEVGTAIAVQQNVITTNEADSINRVSRAVGKTFDDITPEQEYYIGRAVAATILYDYEIYNNAALTHYLNVIGQTLSRASDKPMTYGGYHFAVIDTDTINAFAAPGGLILVSRGLLRCCKTEDALAAVLSHEIGHVEHADGLKAIQQSRLTTALTVMAAEGAKNFGGRDLAELTAAFEGSVSDVVHTLVVSGYSRQQELSADRAAVTIMQRVGYDPAALISMLEEMKKRIQPGAHDFAQTHPDPSVRIAEIKTFVGVAPQQAVPPARQQRFDKAMQGIL